MGHAMPSLPTPQFFKIIGCCGDFMSNPLYTVSTPERHRAPKLLGKFYTNDLAPLSRGEKHLICEHLNLAFEDEKNETLEQDLEMARELQQAMLPHRDFLDEDVLFRSASKPNRGAHEERMKLT
jgi:hypothetical protein